MNPSKMAGGQSRAAKKRAKKKQKLDHFNDNVGRSSADLVKELKDPPVARETSKTAPNLVQPAPSAQEPCDYPTLQKILGKDMSTSKFFTEYAEKQPLHCTKPRSLDWSIAPATLRSWLPKLQVGRDYNVTQYTHGTRKTLDDSLKDASPQDVFHKFTNDACTIRLLGPHLQDEALRSTIAHLEAEFSCMVGCNAYWTPPAAQGFAPHADDVDAYCLQMAGTKRWKVYKPVVELPRTSSPDYTREQINDMICVLDIVLEPGHLLYMPRGWIHEAVTTNQESLHITLSTHQQWAWIDLLEQTLPAALETAATEVVELRQALPRNFQDYMGTVQDEGKVPDCLKTDTDEDELRKQVQRLQDSFKQNAKAHLETIMEHALERIHQDCDDMALRFLSDRQPPVLSSEEQQLRATDKTPITPTSTCCLLQPGIARLCLDHGMAILYHCVDNSLVYRERPLQPLEFELDDAPALEQLLSGDWIIVKELIHDSIEDKMAIVQALVDEGILLVRPGEEE